MRTRDFPFWQAFFTLTFLVLVLPVGLRQWTELTDSLPSDELRILRLVHHSIVQDYVEDRDPDQLMLDAIDGMVGKLDRHSSFVPPNGVQEFENEQIEGAYQGIGILLVPDHTPPTVRWPLPGGPAEEAGIRVGDRILAVDGDSIAEVSREEANAVAHERIVGPAGTDVTLTIERDGSSFDLVIGRDNVRTNKIKWAHLIEPGIAYVHIESFKRNMVHEFDRVVGELERASGAPLRGMIVDLRFLKSGTIVSLKRRGSEVVDAHSARANKCTLPDLPVVILANELSASASEVFTGAMQDHGRARIVGVRTYGKGVVQSIYQWRDLDFRLKLTTAHYYTPNGRSIEARMRREGDGDALGGIEPDVEVPLTEAQDRAVGRELAAAEAPAAYEDAAVELGAKLGFDVGADPDPADDLQLARAIEELTKLIEGR